MIIVGDLILIVVFYFTIENIYYYDWLYAWIYALIIDITILEIVIQVNNNNMIIAKDHIEGVGLPE